MAKGTRTTRTTGTRLRPAPTTRDRGGRAAQHAVAAPSGATTADTIVTLQRLAGNHAVVDLLAAQGGSPTVPSVQRAVKIDPKAVTAIEGHGELIDRIAAEVGFDPDLVRGIIAAESGGNERSGAGTKGYKGLMQSSKDVSHLDPETSIRAGIQKYRDKQRAVTGLLRKYGTSFESLAPRQQISLVMVAYNAGEGTLSRAMGYAAAAGDVTKWNEPEHFQRALLYYGAYSTSVGASRLVSNQGPEVAATHLAAFEGVTVDVIRTRYAPKGKWNTKGLRSALVDHLERERGKSTKQDLAVADFREQYPLLAYSAAVKHDNLRQWYIDKVVAYTEHFADSPLAGGQEVASGGASSQVSLPNVTTAPAAAGGGGGGGGGNLLALAGAAIGVLNRVGQVLGMPDLTQLAASAGYDEVALTNAVFFLRHPELGGRKIRPEEKKLAREWLQIRDMMIRPFLKAAAQRPVTTANGNGGKSAGVPAPRPAPAPAPAAERPEPAAPLPKQTGATEPAPGKVVERSQADPAFVHDAMRSTIELLPEEQRARFEAITWGWLDFPGNQSKPVKKMSPTELATYERDAAIVRHSSGAYFVGKHQDDAKALLKALADNRPGGGERRVNWGKTAVLTKEQWQKNKDGFDAYIASQLAPVPGGKKMNKHAAAAFADMRKAAEADGVVLSIRSGYRGRDKEKANAEKHKNRIAVADFSPHSLGLAMDLNLWTSGMEKTGGKWVETSTQNFKNFMRMHQSPAYKWMYLRGAEFGFYQYRNEPWHWEYNPDNFKKTFYAENAALSPGAS